MSTTAANTMEKVPESCEGWNDDVRMNSLFAPFRQRTVNPLDWDTKLSFWKSLICKWCMYNKKYSFTIADLKTGFQRKGNIPACLETVIDEMLRNKELILCSDLTYMPPDKTWTRWTFDLLVVKPLSWTYNTAKKRIVSPPAIEDVMYVHVQALKDKANILFTVLKKNHDGEVLDLEEISALYQGYTPSLEEVMLTVHWLRKERKLSLYDLGDGRTIVKVGSEKITESDKAIFSLQHAEKTLWKHIEKLESEKLTYIEEARASIRKGQRQMAKVSLWKKKSLENCLDRRINALENVRQMLERIREAKSDAQVIEAYKTGTAGLRSLMKDSGLTEDTAADTMLNIEEALDIQNEIQSTLSQPIGDSLDNLEEELAALLLDDTSSGTQPHTPGGATRKIPKEAHFVLPEPPTHMPSPELPEVPSQQLSF